MKLTAQFLPSNQFNLIRPDVLESIYAISNAFTSFGLNEYFSFYVQRSWLDSFYIGHFDERDDFIHVTKKGLLLDKADFSKKGYRIDERKFPRNPEKVSSSSGKGKQKVDELINLSDDERENVIMEEDDAVHLSEDLFQEWEDEEDVEDDDTCNRVPLKGYQLGGARAGEEYSANFAKAKFEGTPRILFTPEGALSEQALILRRRDTTPTQSLQEFSPLLPLNPLKRRKGTGAKIEPITLMFLPPNNLETMQVASQASVNAKSQKEKVQTIID
jgi:hypothetical protein